MSSITTKQAFWLKVAHVVAALGHIVSAIAIVAFSGSAAWTPSLELSYEYWQEVPCGFESENECFSQGRYVDTFSFSLVAICAIFAGWSGIWHIITLWKWDSVYLKDLEMGISSFRWNDYVVSSSLMISTIAVFSGIVDCWTVLTIVLIQAAVIELGRLSEKMILKN